MFDSVLERELPTQGLHGSEKRCGCQCRRKEELFAGATTPRSTMCTVQEEEFTFVSRAGVLFAAIDRGEGKGRQRSG